MRLRTLLWFVAALALPSLLTASTCPAVTGESTDCDFVLTISAGGTPGLATVPNATGYNGNGHAGSLVGIVNNSGAVFTGTVTLQGLSQPAAGDGIFDFAKLNGVCNLITAAYCNGAATGYEGPLTTFSGILSAQSTYDLGTVNILNVPAGGTTYFSIEGTPANIAGNGGIKVLGGGSGAAPKCPIVGGATNTDCAFILTINANGSGTITAVPNANPYDSVTSNGALVGVVNNSGGVFTGSFTLQGTFPKTGGTGGIFDFNGTSGGTPANAGDGICNLDAWPGCFSNSAPTGYEGPLTSFSGITPTGDCNTCASTGTVNIANLAPNATTYFALQGSPAGITSNGGIGVISGGPGAGSGTVCPLFSGYTGVNQNCGFVITIGASGTPTVGAGAQGNTIPSDSSVVGVVNNSGAPFTGSFSLSGHSGFSGIFQFSDSQSGGICTYDYAPYCPTTFAYEGPLVTYSIVANTAGGCTGCTGVVNINNLPTGGNTYFSIALTPSEINTAGGLTIGSSNANLAVPNATLPVGYTGTFYSQNLTAVNGMPPYTWSLGGGVLPTGLILSSSGTLSGTPTATGTFNFTATATDSAHAMASGTITVTIKAGLMVSNATLPAGDNGTAYSQSLTATNGAPPYSWSLGGGSLPSGLTLSSAGVVSGTPTATGTFNFTATAMDSANNMASGNFGVTINASLAVPNATLPSGVTGAAYSQTLTATNGTTPYTWSLTGGSLPTGLTLSSAGVLSGTPTAAGAFNFTATATDSAHAMASGNISVTITAPLTVPNATLTTGYTGTAYSQNLTANNGTPPYTWAQSGGSLPTGLTLSSAGTLSGTPTATGTFNFIATATDSAHAMASGTITVTINAGLAVPNATLPAGDNGTAYSQSLTATNGAPPYSWSLGGGSLPTGLTLSSAGVVSGTPTATGTFNFTAAAMDSAHNMASGSISVTINAALAVPNATLPGGVTGAAYSQTLTATNGTTPYTWSLTGGSLPTGLILNSSGLLSGTPTATGTFNFTATATDAAHGVTSGNITVTITAALAVPNATLPGGITGTGYSQNLTAVNGTPPYTWSLGGGSLPTGLTLSSAGLLSGTPTAGGTFNFTATAMDSAHATASGSISVTITTALAVPNATLPAGVTGTGYSQTLTATNGMPPYTWSLGGGSLPTGLTLSSAGLLSGTPTATGVFNFTATALDAAHSMASGSISVTITAGISVPNAALPGGVIGTGYSQNLTAINGTPPYTWSVTGGSLPTGLTLSAAGLLSGIPTAAGPFNFTATVTDSLHAMASGSISVTIGAPSAFVVVTRNAGLVGLSSNGTSIMPIAPAASGYDLTEDGNSNLIVAANGSLLRVSQSGQVSTVATAPEGSQWLSVSIDSQGNFIVADNAQHAVWRVSPDGMQVTKVANYPVGNQNELEDVTVRVDSHGNYIVAEDNGSANLFSITPGGQVNAISITGAVTPGTVGGVAFDGNGNYVISDYAHSELFTVTTAGAASVLANGGDSLCCGALGIARVPSSGAYLVALSNSHAIASVGSNGNNITTFASSVAGLPQPMSIIVNVAAALAPTAVTISGNTNLGTIPLGGSLSGSLTASGGTPPYTWSANGLPAGVTFSGGSTGGTPTQAGSFAFTATVKDTYGSTTSTVVSFSVFGITTTALPNAVTSTFYSQSLSATGSSAFPLNYSASGVPAGLTLNQTGLLSGIATTPGTYQLAVQVSDSNGVTSKVTISLTVVLPPPITVPAQTLTSGVVGTRYSQSVSAMGGAPPYTWSVAGGALPNGLTLSAQGVVAGTPTAIGTFTFSARATDVTAGSATGAIMIAISAPPLTLTAPPLPSGMVGVNYPMQLLNASGGVAPYTFALGQGSSLPAGLSLSSAGAITGTPTGAGTTSFTVVATDSNSSSGTVNLQILVRPFSADLFISSGGLTFSSVTGSTTTPPAQNVQVQSTVVGTTLSWSAAVAGGTAWLSVSPGGGTTPGAFSVSLTPQALALPAAVTPYTASITVMCVAPSPCAGNSQTVGVSLSVTNPAPQLTVLNDLLAFTASVAAPQASTLTLNIQNTGGGTVGIASVTSGAGWVTVAGVPGSIAPGPAVPLTVTADPTPLAAGFYRTTITIVSSAGTFVTPVTMFVATNPTMALEPGGVQFQIVAGGAPGNVNNSFLVDVSSNTPVSWKAAVQPGASWLSVATPTGSSTAAQPGAVTFVLDPVISAGLVAGAYYGTIRVTAAGVVNSPLDFEVVLNVLGANAPLTPAPGPSGLLFITSGALAPPTQNVQLFSNSAGAIAYQASATTTDGAAWLTVSPATGSATPAGSTSQVKVNPAALNAPGIYFGGVSYAFGSAGVRTVDVALVLEPFPPGASTAQLKPEASSNCTSSLMAPAQVGLVNNFSAPTAWPTPISIQLVDNCGNFISNGQIVTTFSNGDPPMALALANSSTGLYAGTWTPRHSASQVSVTAKATAPGLPAATAVLTGAVTPNSAPILTPQSTLHIFNPQVGAGLGPGTIVQLYGSNLAAQTTVAPSVPLATNLNGTSVIIGGMQVPLFFVSTGQINAQIPFELNAGQQYQIIVNANGALTTPDTIQLTPVAPGIAALATGTAIAQHADGSLVTETSPAKPGENLVIYTAGLGDTDNPVATGAGSPSNPLARPLTMPTLTINGENANVLFAGLTPGLVGLYQVNFTVPADAANGDLALVLSQSGTVANSTILPVHN